MPMLAALLCTIALSQPQTQPLEARLQVQTGAMEYRMGAFSPDDSMFACVSGAGNDPAPIIVWQAATGRQTLSCEAPPDLIISEPNFSADGKRLSALTRAGLVTWDAVTGKQLDFRPKVEDAESLGDRVVIREGRTISVLNINDFSANVQMAAPEEGQVFLLDEHLSLVSKETGEAVLFRDGKELQQFAFKRKPESAQLAGKQTILLNFSIYEKNVPDYLCEVIDLRTTPASRHAYALENVVALDNAFFGLVEGHGVYAEQSDWRKTLKIDFASTVNNMSGATGSGRVFATGDAGWFFFDPKTGKSGAAREYPKESGAGSAVDATFDSTGTRAMLLPWTDFGGDPVLLEANAAHTVAVFKTLAGVPGEIGLTAGGQRLGVNYPSFFAEEALRGTSLWNLNVGSWMPPSVPGANALYDTFPESMPDYVSYFLDGTLFDLYLPQMALSKGYESGAEENEWALGFYGKYLITKSVARKDGSLDGTVDGKLKIYPRLESGVVPIVEPFSFYGESAHGVQSKNFWLVTEKEVRVYSALGAEYENEPPLPFQMVLDRSSRKHPEGVEPLEFSLNLSASSDDSRLLAIHRFSGFDFSKSQLPILATTGVALLLDAGRDQWSALKLDDATEPVGGRLTANGRYAYVTTEDSRLIRFSTETMEADRELKLGSKGISTVLDEARDFAFVATQTGIVLVDLKEWKVAATMVARRDGSWSVVTPEGRFDTDNPTQPQGLYWIFSDEPNRPFPVELLMRDFYEPRLLSRILARETFKPLSITKIERSLPSVMVTSISEPDSESQVTVKVLVRGEGTSAQDLHLLRDGQLVGQIKGELVKVGDAKEFSFEHIHLPRNGAEEAVFEAYAFNSARAKSETAALKTMVKLERANSRAFILGVGVNEYDDPAWNLKFAAEDAKLTAAALEQALNEGGKYDEVMPGLLLSDGDEKMATKANLSVGFAELQKELTPQDLLVIHWAGHGYAAPDGLFYFIPSDIGSSFDVAKPDQLKRAISSEEMAEWLRPIDCERIILIVDACNSEATVAAEGFKPGPMGARGLGQLAYDKGMMVVAATQTANVALESGEIGHGLLTFALAQGLLNNGDQAGYVFDLYGKEDGKKASFHDLFTYMSLQVPFLHQLLAEGKLSLARTGRVSYVKDKRAGVQQPQIFDFTRGDPRLVLGR